MSNAPSAQGYPERVAAITALQTIRNSGDDAEIALRLANNPAAADDVWAQTSRLRTEIDILIGQLMDTWDAQTTTLTATLIQEQAGIDASVSKIKNQQDVANQVVALLGLLDSALAIAVKFV